MLYSFEEMLKYSSALQVPRSMSLPFLRKVDKWVLNSGFEWTVDHLKTIYLDFVRYRAGLHPVGKWYTKTKDGLPSSASALFRYSNRGKKQRFAVTQLLRVYTIFVSHHATEKQLDKFKSGVNAEPISVPTDIMLGLRKAATLMCDQILLKDPRPYLMYSPSPSKRVPHFDGNTYPESTHWQSQFLTLKLTYTGHVLRSKYRTIFDSVLGFQQDSANFVGSRPHAPDVVGKIGLIQEPGYKLRAVANPNRIYQMALEPLGDALYHQLNLFSWDCTHNQSRAHPVIQERLKQGAIVHCIDLTGATDYFPLDLQIETMKSFIHDKHGFIDLFYDLSRSSWLLQGEKISWKKGQPLGLYPSFASFALTHGLLLFYLNDYSHENDFYILGDDVVIMNDDLYSKYIQTLYRLGCPISISKSISSSDEAEFAGKLIFKDDVIPQLKWRQFSDDSFVDAVRLLGKQALHLLRPRQRKVVKAIWDIPDFLGGLGMNPDGIPLEDRYYKYLSLFGEDCGSYLMSYDRLQNDYFYSQPQTSGVIGYPVFTGIKELPDLDQRSLALVSKYLPNLMRLYKVLGANLYTVVPNKDILPIEGRSKSRLSLLEVIERKLAFN